MLVRDYIRNVCALRKEFAALDIAREIEEGGSAISTLHRQKMIIDLQFASEESSDIVREVNTALAHDDWETLVGILVD